MSHSKRFAAAGLILPALVGACLLIGEAAHAQVSGYKVGEDKQVTSGAQSGTPSSAGVDKQFTPGAPPTSASPPAGTDSQDKTADLQRQTRFDYINGKVTWRPDDHSEWKKAATDRPLGPGAQIWVTEGGRAEVLFDDGSVLRIGNNSVVTLKNLYTDAQGEFTQVKMVSGLVTVRPQNSRSVFEVDTPVLTVNTAGPSRVRVGVSDTVEVGVKWGKATLDGKQGKTTLYASQFVDLRDSSAPYDKMRLPRDDSWERWNDERDHVPSGTGRPYRVYSPPPAFFFGLNIPIGGPGYWHGWGRGAWRH